MALYEFTTITSRQSLENVKNWKARVNKSAPASACKILIGNKCDLQRSREVGFEEGETLASEFNIPFFETSAMNDINVDVELLEANNTGTLDQPSEDGSCKLHAVTTSRTPTRRTITCINIINKK